MTLSDAQFSNPLHLFFADVAAEPARNPADI